jgi:GNAT superfamily N-acetyltransferase
VTGTVEVRDATNGDAGCLARLLAGGSLTVRENPAEVSSYRRALREIEADPRSRVLVAERDGEVVGMCQLFVLLHLQHQGGRCAEIESMHVAAGHRSSGIGAVLLEAAVDAARQAGCYRIQLTSDQARPDAHRFYQRHGFAPTHVGFKRYLS